MHRSGNENQRRYAITCFRRCMLRVACCVLLVAFALSLSDLGNEVNDEMLSHAFRKYPTFLKARFVLRRMPSAVTAVPDHAACGSLCCRALEPSVAPGPRRSAAYMRPCAADRGGARAAVPNLALPCRRRWCGTNAPARRRRERAKCNTQHYKPCAAAAVGLCIGGNGIGRNCIGCKCIGGNGIGRTDARCSYTGVRVCVVRRPRGLLESARRNER